MECKCEDYFQIKSTENRILYFEVKGFWSDIIVEKLSNEIFNSWKKAVDSYQGKKFISIPDMTNFKVARDKGKALIAKMMKYSQANNLHHSIQIMPEAMARIVIAEPVKEVGHGVFRSVVHSFEAAQKLAIEKLREVDEL